MRKKAVSASKPVMLKEWPRTLKESKQSQVAWMTCGVSGYGDTDFRETAVCQRVGNGHHAKGHGLFVRQCQDSGVAKK